MKVKIYSFFCVGHISCTLNTVCLISTFVNTDKKHRVDAKQETATAAAKEKGKF